MYVETNNLNSSRTSMLIIVSFFYYQSLKSSQRAKLDLSWPRENIALVDFTTSILRYILLMEAILKVRISTLINKYFHFWN